MKMKSPGWSPEVEKPVYATLTKRGLSLETLNDARKAEIREALAKLQAFLDDLELSVEEYENKIQLGSIALLTPSKMGHRLWPAKLVWLSFTFARRINGRFQAQSLHASCKHIRRVHD